LSSQQHIYFLIWKQQIEKQCICNSWYLWDLETSEATCAPNGRVRAAAATRRYSEAWEAVQRRKSERKEQSLLFSPCWTPTRVFCNES